MRLKIISADRAMTASAPENATNQSSMEITRRINLKIKVTEYFQKLTLATGQVIERSAGKKSKKTEISLYFVIIETDRSDLTSMRYSDANDQDIGSLDFYLGLKPEFFEKLYNEIALGIIPTHVDIKLPIDELNNYGNSAIKFGNGDAEYCWDNVTHKVVKLDNFEFYYAHQKLKSHSSQSKKLIDYVKAHKIEAVFGIILLMCFLAKAWW